MGYCVNMTNSEEPPYDTEHTPDAFTREEENAANLEVLYRLGLVVDLDLVSRYPADLAPVCGACQTALVGGLCRCGAFAHWPRDEAATTQPEHVHAFRYEHDRGSWFCRLEGCNEEK